MSLTANEEGRLAAASGKSTADNPYTDGTLESVRWRTGFDGGIAEIMAMHEHSYPNRREERTPGFPGEW